MLAIVGMKLGDTRKNTENQDEREKRLKRYRKYVNKQIKSCSWVKN